MDSNATNVADEQPESSIEHLTAEECWRLLDNVRFGRLAVAAAGDLDIFPINFAVNGEDLYFRTGEGTKLMAAMLAERAALEADYRDKAAGEAWSVVVKGRPEVLDQSADIAVAEELDLQPSVTTPKQRFIRLSATRISGRRFRSIA